MTAILALPAFSDNYIWCWLGPDGLAVVDPGAAGPVLAELARCGQPLAGILITHHHPDHIGGLGSLCAQAPVPVLGPADARIPFLTRTVSEGDRLHLNGLDFQVLDLPGHTRSHIAFHAPGVLFCGDTLFASGCGRLFEGTPAQMLASLDKLCRLPDDTRVYCGHEYTLANCRFAAAAEPDCPDVAARLAEVLALRAENRITLPTTLAQERRCNPFLHSDRPTLKRHLAARIGQPIDDRVDCFAALRAWKDHFPALS